MPRPATISASTRTEIIRLNKEGVPTLEIAGHLSLSHSAVSDVVSVHKVANIITGPLKANKDALDGDPTLPGYQAWLLVHHEGLSAAVAAKRMGLKYPSQVYMLLELHKKALDSRNSTSP